MVLEVLLPILRCFAEAFAPVCGRGTTMPIASLPPPTCQPATAAPMAEGELRGDKVWEEDWKLGALSNPVN